MQSLRALDNIQDMTLLQGRDSKYIYRIQIDAQASDLIGSEIGQFIFRHQGDLYRLQPIYRTLETLFKEAVSSKSPEENLHVA